MLCWGLGSHYQNKMHIGKINSKRQIIKAVKYIPTVEIKKENKYNVLKSIDNDPVKWKIIEQDFIKFNNIIN